MSKGLKIIAFLAVAMFAIGYAIYQCFTLNSKDDGKEKPTGNQQPAQAVAGETETQSGQETGAGEASLG